MAFTFNPLWKTLINKNMNKEDLRSSINASPSTIAKLSKNEYVALRVIDDICNVLKVKSITEVMEFISDDIKSEDKEYTDDFTMPNNFIIREENNNEYKNNTDKLLYDTLIHLIDNRTDFDDEEYDGFRELYFNAAKKLSFKLQIKVLEYFVKSINTKNKDIKE